LTEFLSPALLRWDYREVSGATCIGLKSNS
jgi:hypothetical protein